METINFTIESLAFQNKHLNGAYSISDIKLQGILVKVFYIKMCIQRKLLSLPGA